MTEQPEEIAFALCQEMLLDNRVIAGTVVAALWAHIIWLHHAISKRVDKMGEKLVKGD